MPLSDNWIKTISVVGVLAFVLVIIGLFFWADSRPPDGTFIYEHAVTDTAHVYVGLVVSTEEGFFLVEEENVWKGANWLNRHGFQLVDVSPVITPEPSTRGMSSVLALIFVKYKDGLNRGDMRPQGAVQSL